MTHCSNFGKRARLKSVHKDMCAKIGQSAAFGRSVAARILRPSKAGVDTVVFSGMRLLEEVFRFGEKVCRGSMSAGSRQGRATNIRLMFFDRDLVTGIL